jgi:hypothetical protein
MKPDTIISPSIGTYRFIAFYNGMEPVCGEQAVFAARQHYLPAVRQYAFQVLLMSHDTLEWINCNESDFTINRK